MDTLTGLKNRAKKAETCIYYWYASASDDVGAGRYMN